MSVTGICTESVLTYCSKRTGMDHKMIGCTHEGDCPSKKTKEEYAAQVESALNKVNTII